MNPSIPVDSGKTIPIKSRQARKWKENVTAYLFIAPLLSIFAVFILYSLYFLIHTSFQNTDISFGKATDAGTNNYRLVLEDSHFYFSVLNNLIFSAGNIFISITIGFIVTVFLSLKFRGSRFFHALFFIPAMLPGALIATVFSMILEYRFGAWNEFLRALGLDFLAKQWLSDPHLAYMSVIVIGVYLIGFPMMYYSADLTTVNTSVLEAAVLDGAGLNRIMWNIVFPLLKNAHKTIIISTLLSSFREFERIYLMTGGGPAQSTEISSIYLFNYFRGAGANIGYVSAASTLLLIIALAISFIQLRMYVKGKKERKSAA
ncbi:sugar ABC transporter permease [Cohnella endophytica]|uniref:Sugar ABC transporter permease n=1 Tax=Cohnella endophytica TaxID=2419778 RepID=A0A494Y0J7_9BACL|nr:sugar ABC transporter permease [Cohnella endophytica]RKP56274.1 sugar ABC transporter permease [Cohnella endophytica]